jgi:hypothetical protein
MADEIIQIALARPVPRGKFAQSKNFNFSFEGSYEDFEELQRAVSECVDKILWDKKGLKGIDTEKAS